MISRRNLIQVRRRSDRRDCACSARPPEARLLAISNGSPFSVPPSARLAVQSPQIPLAGGQRIPKFVDSLPTLDAICRWRRPDRVADDRVPDAGPADWIAKHVGLGYLQPRQTTPRILSRAGDRRQPSPTD